MLSWWTSRVGLFYFYFGLISSFTLPDNCWPFPPSLPVPPPRPVVGIMLRSARSFATGSLNLFPPSSGRIPFNEDPNPNPHSSGPSTPLKNQIYSFSPSKSYSRQSSSSDTDLSLTPKTGKALPPTLFWFVSLFCFSLCYYFYFSLLSLLFTSLSFFLACKLKNTQLKVGDFSWYK